MRTYNGGHAAVGTQLCPYSTSRAERAAILAREAEVRKWRKQLPRKRTPEYAKHGPVTVIDMSGVPC